MTPWALACNSIKNAIQKAQPVGRGSVSASSRAKSGAKVAGEKPVVKLPFMAWGW